MTDDQMLEAVRRLRDRARRVGTLSPLWDIIFDAEAILAGKPSLLDRPTIERILTIRAPA